MRMPLMFLALALSACTHSIPLDSPAPAEPQAQNLKYISNLGNVESSAESWQKHFAVDREMDSWWNSQDFAPQWLEIGFPKPTRIGRVELIVAQVSPGPATHKVRLENNAGKMIVWHRFDTELANDGDSFILKIDPPKYASKVRVLTTRHPGWVAYRELRIFGIASDTQTEFVPIVATGLSRPVYLTHAGDGSGRLFILEQKGRIRVVKDGILLDEPFLDISQIVDAGALSGLRGIAFPPNYAREGRLYVSYTSVGGQNTVSRFHISHSNPDRADPDSEEPLMLFDRPSTNHSVGTLAFGPRDGYLYIAVGDGHRTELLYPRTPQDPGSLHGKILRIDVESEVKPYAIPPDNPFVGMAGHATEIWALGLRNPWGIAFDQDNGALFIPDAGHMTREEVNYQPADSTGGENYGWPCWEGDLSTGECHLDDTIAPVAWHGRESGCVIVGGSVFEGRFFFSDYCGGKVWSLGKGQSGWETVLIARIKTLISSVGIDQEGNLYALDHANGVIYRIGDPQ